MLAMPTESATADVIALAKAVLRFTSIDARVLTAPEVAVRPMAVSPGPGSAAAPTHLRQSAGRRSLGPRVPLRGV
jgi:hypothetical protein